MPVWLTNIFGFLSSLFKYISDKQLLDAGKAEERVNVDKAQKEADKISQAEIVAAETVRNNNSAGDEFLLPPEQRKH